MSMQLKPSLNFIDGEFCGDVGSTTQNPSDGSVVGEYAAADVRDIDDAVLAARRAFEKGGWCNNPRRRSSVLLAMADALALRRDMIIAAGVAESGKRTIEISHEFDAAVTELRYYAGLARAVFGRTQEVGEGAVSIFSREPIGVVAIIVPWNAPITLLVRSLAPVFAAGCTAVVKPAAQTSLTNGLIIEAFSTVKELGAGILNSVNDSGVEGGKALVAHPQVDAISFTGAHATAAKIVEATSVSLKRLNLELGGKAPAIVFADANLDLAVDGVMKAAFAAAGQMCTAVARVLVEDSAYDAMAKMLSSRFGALNVAAADDPSAQMGPLIDRKSRERLLGVIDTYCSNALVRGGVPKETPQGGNYLTPTLVEVEDLSSPLVQDELFGPIVTLERISDEDEAIARSNATIWGLASSVWTENGDRAFRVARSLKAGTVWMNCHNRLFAEAETGGFKASGVGRLHGLEGLDSFLETKHIYLEPGFTESRHLPVGQ